MTDEGQIPLVNTTSTGEPDQEEMKEGAIDFGDHGLTEEEELVLQLQELRQDLQSQLTTIGFEQSFLNVCKQMGINSYFSLHMLRLGHFEQMKQHLNQPKQELSLLGFCQVRETRQLEVLDMLKEKNHIDPIEVQNLVQEVNRNAMSGADYEHCKLLLEQMKTKNLPLHQLEDEYDSTKRLFAKFMRSVGSTHYDFERFFLMNSSDSSFKRMIDILLVYSNSQINALASFNVQSMLDKKLQAIFLYNPANAAQSIEMKANSLMVTKKLQLLEPCQVFEVKEVLVRTSMPSSIGLELLQRHGHTLNEQGAYKFMNLHIPSPFENKGRHYQLIRYAYHPVKQVVLTNDSFEFSSNAIYRLRTMANCTDLKKGMDLATSFLQDMGSHVSLGPITIGGIFAMVASITSDEDPQSVKAQLQAVLDDKASSNGLFAARDPCTNFTDTELGKLKQKVKITFHTLRGEKEEEDIAVWNIILNHNHAEWGILDIGSNKKPIWELVLSKCNSELCANSNQAATLLHKAWMALTKTKFPFEVIKDLHRAQNLQNMMINFSERAHQIENEIEKDEQEAQINELIAEMVDQKQEYTDLAFIPWLDFVNTSDKMKSAIKYITEWLQKHGQVDFANLQKVAEIVSFGIPPRNFSTEESTRFQLVVTKQMRQREFRVTEDLMTLLKELVDYKQTSTELVTKTINQLIDQHENIAGQTMILKIPELNELRLRSFHTVTLLRLYSVRYLLFDPMVNTIVVPVDLQNLIQLKDRLYRSISDLNDVLLDKKHQENKHTAAHAYLVYCCIILAEGQDLLVLKHLFAIVSDSVGNAKLFGRPLMSFKNTPSELKLFCFEKIEEILPDEIVVPEKAEDYNAVEQFSKQFSSLVDEDSDEIEPKIKEKSPGFSQAEQPSQIMESKEPIHKGEPKVYQQLKSMASGIHVEQIHLQPSGDMVSQAFQNLNRFDKIQINEVRRIYSDLYFESSVSEASDKTMIATEAERPNQVLRQLLMKNPDSLKLISQENFNYFKPQSQLAQVVNEDDIDDPYGEEVGEQEMAGEQAIKRPWMHGLDILCSLLLVSEHNVREIIIWNMMVCLQATPLMLPSLEMMVYPYQNQCKSWSTFDSNHELQTCQQVNLFTHKAPIISFIRASEICQINKSSLINDIFCEKTSPAFLTKDKTSTCDDKLFSRGTIEMIQYCPEFKAFQNNQINEMVTILNLRGIAHAHPKQLKFLMEYSDLIVVVANEYNDFESLGLDPQKMLWVGKTNNVKAQQIGKSTINSRFVELSFQENYNHQMNIYRSIAAQLNSNSASLKRLSLEDISKNLDSNDYTLDLDSSILKRAYSLAQQFVQLSKDSKKQQIVPLQGEDLWGKISENQKKKNKLSNERISYEQVIKETNKLQQEIEEKRQRQVQYACNLHKAIQFFIETMCREEAITVHYFIEFLIQYMNERSKIEMKPLRANYHQAYTEYKRLSGMTTQQDREIHKRKEDLQTKIEKLGEEIMKESFGFEHLIRECGQIYQAICIDENEKSLIQKLPKKVAEQLLLGSCIELMDGENSFIPVKWIQSILKELDTICGKPFVNCQSIIGEQSSGKSTFLNALYNSKFAVAAERCTKGIFLQVIEIDESVREKYNLKSKFVINLDTEGLRSPELQGNMKKSLNHDNEMATLIISIADQTILNIDGQGLGQMKEILDIAVHAILKIRSACGTSPQLKIVHQKEQSNNPEQAYQEQILKTTQELDKETLITARLLKMEQSVRCFADVIPLDQDRDYVKPLFEAQKQNASFSIKYLKKVHEIKDKQLNNLQRSQEVKQQTFASISNRVGTLWECLLKENFAFAFQNNAEIAAHQDIENIKSKVLTSVYQDVENKRQSLAQTIRGEEQEVQNVFITSEFEKLKNELINKHTTSVQAEVQSLSASNERISFYKDGLLNQIVEKVTQITLENQDQLLDFNQEQNLKKKITSKLESFKMDIVPKIQSFYERCKDEVDGVKNNNNELNQMFRSIFWAQHLEAWGVQNMENPKQRIFPWNEFREILQDMFVSQSQTAIYWLDSCKKNTDILKKGVVMDKNRQDIMLKEYLIMKKKKQGQQASYNYSNQLDSVITVSKELQEAVTDYTQSQLEILQSYSRKNLEVQINEVRKKIENANQSAQMKDFQFSTMYQVKTIAKFVAAVIPEYEKRIEKDLEMLQPMNIVEQELYPAMSNYFITLCQQLSLHDTQLQLLFDILKQKIESRLDDKDIVLQFKTDKLLSGSGEYQRKHVLVKKIMQEILDGNTSFRQVQLYNKKFEIYMQRWIRAQVEQQVVSNDGQQFINNKKDEVIGNVVTQIKESFRHFKGNTLGECLTDFLTKLKQKIANHVPNMVTFLNSDFSLLSMDLPFYQDDDRDKFCQSLVERLEEYGQQKHIEFDQDFINLLTSEIVQKHTGCNKTCKLCGVVCDRSQVDHDGKCSSNNHKYPALLGYVKSQSQNLYIEYNCCGAYHAGTKVNGKTFEQEVCTTWDVVKAGPNNIECSQNPFYQWLLVKYKKDFLHHYFKNGFDPWDPCHWGTEAQLKNAAVQFVQRYGN